MDRIIALKEGNIDLLSRERYWRAGEGDDVELEDRDIEGRTLEADRAKK